MIKNVIFQDDDTEESVVAFTLEADLLTNGNDAVIIIVDIRRVQKKVRTKIVPMPSKGDLDFPCNCSVTMADSASLDTRAYSWYPKELG